MKPDVLLLFEEHHAIVAAGLSQLMSRSEADKTTTDHAYAGIADVFLHATGSDRSSAQCFRRYRIIAPRSEVQARNVARRSVGILRIACDTRTLSCRHTTMASRRAAGA